MAKDIGKSTMLTILIFSCILFLGANAIKSTQTLSSMQTASKLGKLVIQPADGDAKLVFGTDFALQLDPTGTFEFAAISSDDTETSLLSFDTTLKRFGSDADLISAKALSAGALAIRGVPQWALISMDLFEAKTTSGWTAKPRAEKYLDCGAVTVLCGNCPAAVKAATVSLEEDETKNTLVKEFALPGKNRADSIQISATFHFIDDWQGESAFLKVDGQYVWTSSHSVSSKGEIVLDICSGDDSSEPFPEDRFSVPIQVSIPYPSTDSDTLKVEFGSNAGADSGAYFGISSFSLSVKKNPESLQQQQPPPSLDVEEESTE